MPRVRFLSDLSSELLETKLMSVSWTVKGQEESYQSVTFKVRL